MIDQKGAIVFELEKRLPGKTIRLERGKNSLEIEVESVRESHVSRGDVRAAQVMLVTPSKRRFPIEIPRTLEVLDNGKCLVLDYNDHRGEEETDVEREDSKFYEFLRRGKGHRFQSRDKDQPVVTLTIL